VLFSPKNTHTRILHQLHIIKYVVVLDEEEKKSIMSSSLSLFGFGVTAEDFAMSRSKTSSSSSSSRRRRRADDDDEESDVGVEEEEEEEKEADEEESTLSLSTATKHIFSIGWPTCLQNVSAAVASLFAVSLISHHEDTTCVAAYGLGTSLCSVTGHCFLWGIGGALDTLSSQSFGMKKRRRVGELFWRAVAILVCTCWLPAMIVWSFAEEILCFMKFPKDVAKLVEVYAMAYAPGLLAQCFSCACLKTLLACKKSNTVAKISVVSSPMTMLLTYACIAKMKFGFVGAPLALTLVDVFKAACYCLSTFVLDEDVKKCFVLRRQSENSSRRGNMSLRRRRPSAVAQFGKAAFSKWTTFFKIALPNLVLSIFEWWAWDLMNLLTGQLPNAKDALAAQTIQTNSMIVVYNIAGCVQRGASSCVGNALGAKKAKEAKIYATASFISAFSGTLLISSLYYAFGFECMNALYSNDHDPSARIILDNYVKPLTNLVSLFMLLDGVQVGLAGVVTGAGFQSKTMPALFVSYWMLALPVGVYLAFQRKMSLVGLWIGMSIGVFFHAFWVLFVVFGGEMFPKFKNSQWTIDWPEAVSRAELAVERDEEEKDDSFFEEGEEEEEEEDEEEEEKEEQEREQEGDYSGLECIGDDVEEALLRRHSNSNS
jgi:MATE family multidrug resistance protein|tara:strand:+ start:1681 stop:3648 length:1968 start_codon:yes stop_codon:yes gene_type:complete